LPKAHATFQWHEPAKFHAHADNNYTGDCAQNRVIVKWRFNAKNPLKVFANSSRIDLLYPYT